MVQNRNKATCGVKNDTADIISNVTEATFFRIEGFNSLAFVSRIKAGVTKDRIKKIQTEDIVVKQIAPKGHCVQEVQI